jgi:Zn-dependent M28 family amino/carboxypeptidase
VFNVVKTENVIYADNVLAFVEGTDLKDEVIVISAHYDHLGKKDTVIYNGADDDGSGTIALLEIAEAVAKAKANGEGPRRSILFIAFSGEEKGLLGSKAYADAPAIPFANTVANLNIDMIGRVDEFHTNKPDYVYIIGSNFLSTGLHSINEAAAKNYTKLDLDYKYNSTTDPNRFYYRSDHYNFAKNNVPVIFYFNGSHPDYHQPSDDVEKINFDVYEQRCKLVFHTMWILANQDARIQVDVVQE